MKTTDLSSYPFHLPSLSPPPTLFLYSSSAKKMLLEISSSISRLFLTHARPYSSHTLAHQPFSYPPGSPPCCSVHQAVCTSVCRALAIVKIWPKKKCVHAEGDGERDGERWMDAEISTTPVPLSHTPSLLRTSVLLLHPYLHTLSFSEKLSLPPISCITSPRLCSSSHFNRFHLRACE
jgi:hypothetical protein